MKIMKFLIPTMLVVISLDSLALDGEGVVLLNEKIEMSPGVNGKFVLISGGSLPRSANASARADNSSGKINQNISISGSHRFSVVNNTRSNQYYNYKFELNSDGRYFRKTDSIMVKPGGNASETASSYFSTMHEAPGRWTINAVTEVSGESSSNGYDRATLTVSK